MVTALRAVRAAEDRLRKGRSGVTVPTFCVIPHRSLSSGHFSLGQAQELVQGFQTPCFLGSSGINVQQLPFLALVSPQVRLLEATELTWPGCPASAVTVTASFIKWLEGRSIPALAGYTTNSAVPVLTGRPLGPGLLSSP